MPVKAATVLTVLPPEEPVARGVVAVLPAEVPHPGDYLSVAPSRHA